MIRVVYKYSVLGFAVDHFATSSLQFTLVSKNNSKEVLRRHIITGVILKKKKASYQRDRFNEQKRTTQKKQLS